MAILCENLRTIFWIGKLMKILGLVFVLSVISSMAVAQDIDLTLKGTRVIHHVDIELSNAQKSVFKKFTK
jgi:hypothetical protein